jgi:hypothetical protein
MKRALIGLFLTAAAGLLAACYTSDKLLLDPAQAATPLATGRQTTAGGDDRPQTLDISLGPDRWYVIHAGADEDRLLFVPLPGGAPDQPRYAFTASDKRNFVYGVAVRRAGQLYFDTPYCDQPAALDAAAAHGVKPPTGKAISPVCTFADAASLMGALKDYADRSATKLGLMHLPAAQ